MSLISVGSLLAIRGILSELSCKRCGEQETINHLFLSCPFATEFWSKVPLVSPAVDISATPQIKDWVEKYVKKGANPPVGIVSSPLIPWFLWNLWVARNKLIFEGKAYTEEEIITKAIVDAKAWEEANSRKEKPVFHQPSRGPSPLNSPTCWCDGAWQESSKIGGMGWIIKNSNGEVMCRGSSNRSHVVSALMAEALAMKEALKKASELNLHSLHLFSDSQVLVLALREERDVIEIAGILYDIRNLATLFHPFSLSFVPRLENSQADALARSGLACFAVVV